MMKTKRRFRKLKRYCKWYIHTGRRYWDETTNAVLDDCAVNFEYVDGEVFMFYHHLPSLDSEHQVTQLDDFDRVRILFITTFNTFVERMRAAHSELYS